MLAIATQKSLHWHAPSAKTIFPHSPVVNSCHNSHLLFRYFLSLELYFIFKLTAFNCISLLTVLLYHSCDINTCVAVCFIRVCQTHYLS